MTMYVIFKKSQRVECTEDYTDFKKFVNAIRKYAKKGYVLERVFIEDIDYKSVFLLSPAMAKKEMRYDVTHRWILSPTPEFQEYVAGYEDQPAYYIRKNTSHSHILEYLP